MKTKLALYLRNILLSATVLGTLTASAHAGVGDGAGTWRGTGTSFGMDGSETAQFTVEMVSVELGPDALESHGKIAFTNGRTTEFSQTLRDRGTGFTIDSTSGRGAGRCFGEGLCESFITSPDQSGTAVMTVLDGENNLRVLVTVLDPQGKPTHFIREKLVRQSPQAGR